VTVRLMYVFICLYGENWSNKWVWRGRWDL